MYLYNAWVSTIVKSHCPTLWAPTSPPQTSAQFWIFCSLSIQRLQLLLLMLFKQLCIFFLTTVLIYITCCCGYYVVKSHCATLYCTHLWCALCLWCACDVPCIVPTSPSQTSAPPPANSFIPSLFNLYPHYPPTVFLIISNKIVCIPLIRCFEKSYELKTKWNWHVIFREMI